MNRSPAEFIAEKREGREHTPEELEWWIDGFLAGTIPEYQVSAWLMAVYFRGMTPGETAALTRLVAESGVKIPRVGGAFRVDKHSTGGIGDKTSLLLVPLVASVAERRLGKGALAIPMVSGRGLGHTGGTLDKLDAVPGFSSRIGLEHARELIASQGFCMMGQTDSLAPADRVLYALRDVTATVECRPLITASILGKKIAEDLDGLVLDVKVGDGAFMKTLDQARDLARALIGTAKDCGLDTVGVVTSMDSPLGYHVGNASEVVESAEYLSGERRHPDLHAVTLELAAWMLRLGSGRRVSVEEAKAWCEEELATERPSAVFRQLFAAQGGDWTVFEREAEAQEEKLATLTVGATESGRLRLRALPFGRLLNFIGGGRMTKECIVDPWVGIELLRRDGELVEEGDPLVRVSHRSGADGSLTSKISALVREAISVVDPTEPGPFGCRVLELIE